MFKTVLLRYNWHIIDCTCLKGTISRQYTCIFSYNYFIRYMICKSFLPFMFFYLFLTVYTSAITHFNFYEFQCISFSSMDYPFGAVSKKLLLVPRSSLPAPGSVMAHWEFWVVHGGKIYTIEVKKCYSQGCFLPKREDFFFNI